MLKSRPHIRRRRTRSRLRKSESHQNSLSSTTHRNASW